MAFTNVWDTTFPPDTQLANLLGQDIRQGVKVDVQQRMAAISGLDAAKPRFDLDAQPANWNGILFFATDTGNIYQFNNPAWTNVTNNFFFRNTAFKNTTPVTFTGDTALHTAFTIAIPGNTLGVTGQLRITVTLLIGFYSSGTMAIKVNYGGVRISPPTVVTAGALGNVDIVLVGGNLGAANSQSWEPLELPFSAGVSNGNVGHVVTAVDSTIAQNLTVTYQGGANSDSATFYRVLAEVL